MSFALENAPLIRAFVDFSQRLNKNVRVQVNQPINWKKWAICPNKITNLYDALGMISIKMQ